MTRVTTTGLFPPLQAGRKRHEIVLDLLQHAITTEHPDRDSVVDNIIRVVVDELTKDTIDKLAASKKWSPVQITQAEDIFGQSIEAWRLAARQHLTGEPYEHVVSQNFRLAATITFLWGLEKVVAKHLLVQIYELSEAEKAQRKQQSASTRKPPDHPKPMDLA